MDTAEAMDWLDCREDDGFPEDESGIDFDFRELVAELVSKIQGLAINSLGKAAREYLGY